MPERINTEVEFDVLGDILETLRFRGSVFFRSDLAAPWGIALQELRVPRFHIALSGTCYIGAAGQEALALNEEDIAILPAGGSHWIADSPGRELVSDTRAGEACELGNPLFQDGAITNRLMCGIVHYDQGSSHPILNALPTIIHFPSQAENESVWSVVSLIDREMQNHQQGSSRIADRLVEVLFLQLLNQFVRDNQDTTGFMAALRDRRVHRALTLIHKEPAFPWSLAMLGERVGMSRATLVTTFPGCCRCIADGLHCRLAHNESAQPDQAFSDTVAAGGGSVRVRIGENLEQGISTSLRMYTERTAPRGEQRRVTESIATLRKSVAACRVCEEHLPLGPRPVAQIGKTARILIAGQAPGIRVHESGVPFDDPSGDRLREWLDLSKTDFYDARKIAIVPMAFCYPGTGKNGDLPPRKECAATWRQPVLDAMPDIELTLLIGQYAQKWHLNTRANLTETVRAWRDHGPDTIPLPHPSPRNNIWLKKNPVVCR